MATAAGLSIPNGLLQGDSLYFPGERFLDWVKCKVLGSVSPERLERWRGEHERAGISSRSSVTPTVLLPDECMAA